jgi:hypothetical protein
LPPSRITPVILESLGAEAELSGFQIDAELNLTENPSTVSIFVKFLYADVWAVSFQNP